MSETLTAPTKTPGRAKAQEFLKTAARKLKGDEIAANCPWPLPAQGIDVFLLIAVAAMVSFGLLMVYSSSFIYAQERTGDGFAFIKKQLLFAVAGFGVLLAACRLNYRKWAEWAYPGLGVATVFLALILIPGIGARVGGGATLASDRRLQFSTG